ncbi:MAG: hypothetical protein Q7J84_10605 [Sulfuricaulis sp.]|nr:hypothetical protein [Sulfuricaulis sp.]
MKASMIYRRAAEEMGATFFYGCALDFAGQPNPGGDRSPLQTKFVSVFAPIAAEWNSTPGVLNYNVSRFA